MTDTVTQVRDALQAAVTRVLETGEAEAVDITGPFAWRSDLKVLTDAQRSIDAATRDRAVQGHVTLCPAPAGHRLAAVLTRRSP